MKVDLNSVVDGIKRFAVETAKDFSHVWAIYPNVLVWSGVVGLFLFWL